MAEFAPDVRAMIDLVRAGHAALPGLALLDLVISGGYESTLYAGTGRVGRAASAIRQLMSATEPPATCESAARRSEEQPWLPR